MKEEVKQAFNVVVGICAQANTTLQGHQQIQAALLILKNELEPKAVVLETEEQEGETAH